jgi:predicted dehydrogenase
LLTPADLSLMGAIVRTMARSTTNKLRLGIIGAGEIVRSRHLPGLKKHSDVEIVAISNSTYESSQKFCEENVPGAIPMQNWADLLSMPEIDIVWVGTPPYMHSAVTISALEAGKHVFCQARMAMDLPEAEEMLATARRFPELVTMLCPPPFGLRGDLLVKKLLAENYLGHPHHVRMHSFTGAYLNADTPAHWRQRIEISGLNVLALGIYVEVLQRWLGDITGVYARGKILHEVRQGYEVKVPDMVTILCTFANGAEGVLEFSGISGLASGDRLDVFGDLGTMSYDFGTDVVNAGKVGDRSVHPVELTPDLAGGWMVEDDFIAAVKTRGRNRPHPDFEDGVKYMRVVQAVADSRKRNEWVAIET